MLNGILAFMPGSIGIGAVVLIIPLFVIFVTGTLMLIAAKLAGVTNATFGKSILAAITASFVVFIVSAVCSIVPVIGTLIGFFMSIFLAALIIKAVFDTTGAKAFLIWIFFIMGKVCLVILLVMLGIGGGLLAI